MPGVHDKRRTRAVRVGVVLLALVCCAGLALVGLMGRVFPMGSLFASVDAGEPLGEGEAIAFSYMRLAMLKPFEVYLLDDAHGVRSISGGMQRADVNPIWSPDGTQLVYQSVWDASTRLVLVDADGARRQQMAEDEDYQMLPRWSPDGTRLAYLAYRTQPDGSGANAPHLCVLQPATGERHQAPAGNIWEMQWLPDGQALLAIERSGEEVAIEVYDTAGKHAQHLAEAAFLREATSVALAPDTTRIAYALPAKEEDALTDPLYVSRLDGSGAVEVGSVWMDGAVVWSPDSTRIAFVTLTDEGFDLVTVVNADGTGLRELLVLNVGDESGEMMPAAPAWSADGTRIAVASYVEADHAAIVVMSADGSEQREVATARRGMFYDVAWRPGGE